MSHVKQKALSGPPSQQPCEGGSNSAPPFTSNTVAAPPQWPRAGLLWSERICSAFNQFEYVSRAKSDSKWETFAGATVFSFKAD